MKLLGPVAIVVGLAACKGASGTASPPEPTPESQSTADRDVSDRDDVEAILAHSDLPPLIESPLPDDPMEVTVHRLSNGMTVYISTDRQKPRFTAWVGVRAGSRMDPADSTGLAHYLEHMLFKGTDDYGTLNPEAEAPYVEEVRELYGQLRDTSDPQERQAILKKIDDATQAQAKFAVPNEIDRIYSTLGVQGTNAFTSFEETVYIGDVPANRLDAWAAVEAERFADPVFRLFYPELEAVYEEKNLDLDSPESRVWESMYATLYPKHPYGTQTTIGSVEHLKNPAFEDMVEYFERWYVPNNMAIVLTGDVDPKTALPVLEESFGRLKPKAVPEPERGEIVPLRGRQETEVVAEGEEAITLAWHTVPVAHEDEPALALMDRVLDDAKVGLLNVELELSQKVPEAGSWESTMTEGGYFAVRARARTGQNPESLEPMLLEVIDKLKKGEFSEADVEAAKLQETVGQKQQLEFPFVRASKLMNAFVTHQRWQDVIERDQRFQALTRDDVIRVANEYLGPDYAVVIKRKGTPDIPKLDKPTITPVAIDPSRKSDFAQRIEDMDAPTLEPQWVVQGEHYERKTIPAGDLIAAKNERNDLFSLTYRVERGYRKDPLLCHALDLLELSGAGDRDAEAFQKELYALGTSVSTECNAETASIEVEGLDENLEASLTLVDAWLSDPKYDAQILERLYDNTISKRRDGLEEDWRLTAALDGYAKHGRDSAWLAQPSNRALKRAKPAKLERLIDGLLDYRHTTLYFGPRAADEVADIVARGERHRNPGPVWTRRYRKVAKPTIYFLHEDGAKANVRFVIPEGSLPREKRPVSELLSEYLSGSMSALVFQEIRESRGLAYTAYSTYSVGDRPKDASGLLGFLSTQADKTPVAVETFLGLLQTDEIQAERLSAALESLDQQYRSTRIDPRWINRWVLSWDELGESEDPRPWIWQQAQKLGVEETAAFARQFVDAPVIIAVVGDRERVGLAELAKIGQVVEVQADDLFSWGPFPETKPSKTKK